MLYILMAKKKIDLSVFVIFFLEQTNAMYSAEQILSHWLVDHIYLVFFALFMKCSCFSGHILYCIYDESEKHESNRTQGGAKGARRARQGSQGDPH